MKDQLLNLYRKTSIKHRNPEKKGNKMFVNFNRKAKIDIIGPQCLSYDVKFIDNKTLLFLKGYYQLQEGNNYLIAGGHVEYSINEIYQDFQESFNLGLYYRVQNAIIPYIGFTYNQLQFGFSYDIQVSQIKNAAIRPNTFELTMIFKKQKKWWNPLI